MAISFKDVLIEDFKINAEHTSDDTFSNFAVVMLTRPTIGKDI